LSEIWRGGSLQAVVLSEPHTVTQFIIQITVYITDTMSAVAMSE
jgi:hypothetical protein